MRKRRFHRIDPARGRYRPSSVSTRCSESLPVRLKAPSRIDPVIERHGVQVSVRQSRLVPNRQDAHCGSCIAGAALQVEHQLAGARPRYKSRNIRTGCPRGRSKCHQVINGESADTTLPSKPEKLGVSTDRTPWPAYKRSSYLTSSGPCFDSRHPAVSCDDPPSQTPITQSKAVSFGTSRARRKTSQVFVYVRRA